MALEMACRLQGGTCGVRRAECREKTGRVQRAGLMEKRADYIMKSARRSFVQYSV